VYLEAPVSGSSCSRRAKYRDVSRELSIAARLAHIWRETTLCARPEASVLHTALQCPTLFFVGRSHQVETDDVLGARMRPATMVTRRELSSMRQSVDF
jgi:hypothetical protein